jgi:hypothetical protein
MGAVSDSAAIVQQAGDSMEQVHVNCQERTREELIGTPGITLRES